MPYYPKKAFFEEDGAIYKTYLIDLKIYRMSFSGEPHHEPKKGGLNLKRSGQMMHPKVQQRNMRYFYKANEYVMNYCKRNF